MRGPTTVEADTFELVVDQRRVALAQAWNEPPVSAVGTLLPSEQIDLYPLSENWGAVSDNGLGMDDEMEPLPGSTSYG